MHFVQKLLFVLITITAADRPVFPHGGSVHIGEHGQRQDLGSVHIGRRWLNGRKNVAPAPKAVPPAPPSSKQPSASKPMSPAPASPKGPAQKPGWITVIIQEIKYLLRHHRKGEKQIRTSTCVSVRTTTSAGTQVLVSSTSVITSTSVLSSDITVPYVTTVPATQTISTTSLASTTTISGPKYSVPSPATGRGKWLPGFDINTDFTKKMPQGKLRHFDLVIDDDHVLAPDGISRSVQVFNGQFTGPPIVVDWGDTIEVTVLNRCKMNGTAVHWHGFTQAGTPEMDGVPGVTQCPIPPGGTYTYRFRADRYGTTWYHSHYSVQYGNGAYGSLVVKGPASLDYDEDLGPVTIGDWYHKDAYEGMRFFFERGPPPVDSVVLNGQGVYLNPTTGVQTGQYLELTKTRRLIPGKKYRLRLINTSTDTTYVFSLDGHNMTVIQTDFVPIIPYDTPAQIIGIGQRYDVVITATGKLDTNAWFRASPQLVCGSDVISNSTARGIVRYQNAPTVDPSTTEVAFLPLCQDPPTDLLKPVFPIDVLPAHQQQDISITVLLNATNKLVFNIAGTDSANEQASSLYLNYNQPTLHLVNDGFKQFPAQYNVDFVNGNATDWVYFNISNDNPIPHPWHLHGHDLSILAQGTGKWDGSVITRNPPRRDTALIPANGHLVIGFQLDNPAPWIAHCHIVWHVAAGLGVQFVENLDRINSFTDARTTYANCDRWQAYTDFNLVLQDDSGV